MPNNLKATPKKNAYFGNRNALKSGLRTFREGKVWPVGTSYIPRIIKKIGDGLRAEVVRQHGATTVYSEALISSAMRHEARALLIERLYRRGRKELSIEKQAELLEKIGDAVNARDRKLAELELSIRPDDGGDIFARLTNGKKTELIDPNEDD